MGSGALLTPPPPTPSGKGGGLLTTEGLGSKPGAHPPPPLLGVEGRVYLRSFCIVMRPILRHHPRLSIMLTMMIYIRCISLVSSPLFRSMVPRGTIRRPFFLDSWRHTHHPGGGGELLMITAPLGSVPTGADGGVPPQEGVPVDHSTISPDLNHPPCLSEQT